MSKRQRWAIRVTFANGEDAWLHEGPRPGVGPIASFDRKTADVNREFVSHGLDDGDVAVVVPFPPVTEATP